MTTPPLLFFVVIVFLGIIFIPRFGNILTPLSQLECSSNSIVIGNQCTTILLLCGSHITTLYTLPLSITLSLSITLPHPHPHPLGLSQTSPSLYHPLSLHHPPSITPLSLHHPPSVTLPLSLYHPPSVTLSISPPPTHSTSSQSSASLPPFL